MGLNLFSMQLNEMTPGLEAKLPPTDTRWRKDLRAIEKGDYATVCTPLTAQEMGVSKTKRCLTCSHLVWSCRSRDSVTLPK